MIMKKKLWENYQGQPNCCLIREHSITHPDYPPKEKPIRADFENGGQYVSPIDKYRTKFYFCSKFNMKLNIGISMIEREGAKGQAKWVKYLNIIVKINNILTLHNIKIYFIDNSK